MRQMKKTVRFYTPEEISVILDMWKDGKKPSVIARKVKRYKGCIASICCAYRSWKKTGLNNIKTWKALTEKFKAYDQLEKTGSQDTIERNYWKEVKFRAISAGLPDTFGSEPLLSELEEAMNNLKVAVVHVVTNVVKNEVDAQVIAQVETRLAEAKNTERIKVLEEMREQALSGNVTEMVKHNLEVLREAWSRK